MSNGYTERVCPHCNDLDAPATTTHEYRCAAERREEYDAMRKQVAEMHVMMTQLAGILKSMESHPMLSAFLPR